MNPPNRWILSASKRLLLANESATPGFWRVARSQTRAALQGETIGPGLLTKILRDIKLEKSDLS